MKITIPLHYLPQPLKSGVWLRSLFVFTVLTICVVLGRSTFPWKSEGAIANAQCDSQALKAPVTIYRVLFRGGTGRVATSKDILNRGRPLTIMSSTMAGEITRLMESIDNTKTTAFNPTGTCLLLEWKDGRQIFVDVLGGTAGGHSPTSVLALPAVQRLYFLVAGLEEKQRVAERADRERKRPVLIKAISTGNIAKARQLLADHADPNVRDLADQDQMPPLMHAAYDGNVRLCQLLLDFHAQVEVLDDNGYTALTYSAMNQQPQTFELLLTRGKASVKGKPGGQALYYAAGDGQNQMIKRLLALGSEVNYHADTNEHDTPLIHAAALGDVESLETARLLLNKGANVNAQETDGRTALFWAALGGDVPMARLLLARGAGVDVPLQDGTTPLFMAVRNKHPDMVRLLLQHGAGVTASVEAEAKTTGSPEITRLLHSKR